MQENCNDTVPSIIQYTAVRHVSAASQIEVQKHNAEYDGVSIGWNWGGTSGFGVIIIEYTVKEFQM